MRTPIKPASLDEITDLFPRLSGERPSEYAARLTELYHAPWMYVYTTANGWVIFHRPHYARGEDLTHAYTRKTRDGARNLTKRLNERHQQTLTKRGTR